MWNFSRATLKLVAFWIQIAHGYRHDWAVLISFLGNQVSPNSWNSISLKTIVLTANCSWLCKPGFTSPARFKARLCNWDNSVCRISSNDYGAWGLNVSLSWGKFAGTPSEQNYKNTVETISFMLSSEFGSAIYHDFWSLQIMSDWQFYWGKSIF